MVDKYFDGEYLKFQVKNEDGTFNETISIHEKVVEDVEDFVAFLKETYANDLADKMFEVFMEFALIHSLNVLNKNRDMIINSVNGDSYGN